LPLVATVLDGLILGLLNKQIAYELDISEGTVKGYRAQVMEKMRAKSLAELVRMTQHLEPAKQYTPELQADSR